METTNQEVTWKRNALIVGAALGAVLGVGTAYLLVRTAEESGGQPPSISTGDAIRNLIAAIALIRGIAALGEGK